jgi:hypothetical protein
MFTWKAGGESLSDWLGRWERLILGAPATYLYREGVHRDGTHTGGETPGRRHERAMKDAEGVESLLTSLGVTRLDATVTEGAPWFAGRGGVHGGPFVVSAVPAGPARPLILLELTAQKPLQVAAWIELIAAELFGTAAGAAHSAVPLRESYAAPVHLRVVRLADVTRVEATMRGHRAAFELSRHSFLRDATTMQIPEILEDHRVRTVGELAGWLGRIFGGDPSIRSLLAPEEPEAALPEGTVVRPDREQRFGLVKLAVGSGAGRIHVSARPGDPAAIPALRPLLRPVIHQPVTADGAEAIRRWLDEVAVATFGARAQWSNRWPGYLGSADLHGRSADIAIALSEDAFPQDAKVTAVDDRMVTVEIGAPERPLRLAGWRPGEAPHDLRVT